MTKNDLNLFNKLNTIIEHQDINVYLELAKHIFNTKDLQDGFSYIDLSWWGYDSKEQMLFEFVTRPDVYETSIWDNIVKAKELAINNGYYFIGPKLDCIKIHFIYMLLNILDLKYKDSIYTYKTLN